MEQPQSDETNAQQMGSSSEAVDLRILCREDRVLFLPQVHTGETLHAIKQVLADFQETASLTAFRLVFQHSVDQSGNRIEKSVTEYGDFSAISAFVNSETKECVFAVVLDPYDLKQMRVHVKRLRELCNRPRLASISGRRQYSGNAPENGAAERDRHASTDSEGESSEEVNVPKTDALKKKQPQPEQASAKSTVTDMPRLETILEATSLQQYLNEALCLTPAKTAASRAIEATTLRNVIKSVHFSGWNPPPAHRKMQGDLLYLEVILATEGTLFITGTSRGFFVNKSNRGHFDPTPAANPHFSHELFNTILASSNSVRVAWAAFGKASDAFFNQQDQQPSASSTTTGDHMESISRLYLNMAVDPLGLVPNAWIAPPNEASSSENIYALHHDYDVARLTDNLLDLKGVEELGAPREWNDEIQSIRSLKATDLNEKILKARLEFRITTEFAECVKRIVLAISESTITPLSYGSPAQSDIYVYNGIFVSRAEDTKDAFKICESDESARRTNGRDLQNQKLLRTLEIEGVGSVLCAIVDYKGIRYVGQSIIPGILSQGEHSARLMYGIMENDKQLTVKESSLAIMKAIGEKISIPVRRISIHPFGTSHLISEAAEAEKEEKVEKNLVEDEIDPLNKLLLNSETVAAPIRVDEIENVAVDSETQTVPHVGPIEGKIIKGTDGRNYVLEMMRLTPRDANYVSTAEHGTGKIEDTKLASLDKNIAMTYVMRQELVGIYLQRQLALARQAVLEEASHRKKEELAKLGITSADASASTAAKEEEEEKREVSEEEEDKDRGEIGEEGMKIVKEEKEANPIGKLSPSEAVEEEEEELRKKLHAISLQSLGIEINPNVYIAGLRADCDEAVVAKDEQTVRDISTMLWDLIMPLFIKQVREGDVTPRDADALIEHLHRSGINIRYLGRLAQLAQDQEREDLELLAVSKQRVHGMPSYFYDMLLIEMLARGTKHLLNTAMRSDKALAAAPAQTIATVLNHLLSLLQEPEEGETKSVDGDVPATTTTATTTAGDSNQASNNEGEVDKKQKKKKKKKNGSKSSHHPSHPRHPRHGQESYADGEILPAMDVYGARSEFLRLLKAQIEERYLYTVPLLTTSEEDEAALSIVESQQEALSRKLVSKYVLCSRISPQQLLRRICQQSGIVITSRAYDFKAATIFTVEDIVTLVPKVKTCEPSSYLPDFQEYIAASSIMLQQNNEIAAFEMAQQALNMIQQVTGTTHELGYQAMEQMTSVLYGLNDIRNAAIMAGRSLALAVQVRGLDSDAAIQQHMRLSQFEMDLGNVAVSLQHLKAALYLIQLTGGNRHPELFNVLHRLSLLYDRTNDFESAIMCLLRARNFCVDMSRVCIMNIAIADILHRSGRSTDAIAYQKYAYKVYKELHGDADERVQSAKKVLEVYLRASSGSALSSKLPLQFVKPDILHRAIGGADSLTQTEEPPGVDGEEGSDKDGGKKKKRSSHKKSKAKK